MAQPNPRSDDLLTAARRWYDAGCCVVPSHRDRSKRPHTAWSSFQQQRPSWLQVEEWLKSGEYDGIGVITGAVSGNLELLEIEGPAIANGAIDSVMEFARNCQEDSLLSRVLTGCSGRSAGGSLHVFIRTTDEPALPNIRLAYDATGKIAAETRGEGGFAIVAPTPARTGHQPGSKYEFISRGPEAIAEVTGEERDILHAILQMSLDQRPPQPPAEPKPTQPREGDTPGDAYTADTTWDEILIPAGWVKVATGHRDGNPQVYWRRPGKTDGVSATTGGPSDHLYVFSSSTVFPTEQPLSRFAAYTYLNHGGDFHVAAKTLARDGYGHKPDPLLRDLSAAFEALDSPDTTEGTTEDSESLGDTFSDLSWVLTGERQPPQQPEHLHTEQGHALFYRARINGIFGDPETAKSWIAQTAITQALLTGHRCVYLDIDHNGAREIAERLLLLGANPTTISNPEQFRIYEPEDRPGLLKFLTDMAQWQPDLVVIDSLGELMPMLGAKSVDNDELTTAMRATLKPLAHKIGACVITIDHLPKSQDARNSGYAIGGIAKKRIIDGTYLSCEAIDPPAPSKIGKIRLTIEKDRHGQVRAHSSGRIAGDYILDSTDPTFTNTRIEMPATGTDGRIKPTSAMRTVSNYLTGLQDWTAPSRNSIHLALTATTAYKRHTIERAIDELAATGHLTIDPNSIGKPSAVRLVKAYEDSYLTDMSKILP